MSLKRTSIPIPHAGGTYPPKPLFEITAGLIAPNIEWADGFGTTFLGHHAALKKECEKAAARSQLLVTTHSPEFVEAIKPSELWIVHRATDGFTRVARANAQPGVAQLLAEGANLGQLWREGYLGVGDPLRGAFHD